MTTLSVTVQRVAYPPATSESDWYILITDAGAAKGKMAWRPQDGEALILEGEYATYKGEREFTFKSARLNVPTDPRDQLHYVCARTPGMGAAMEQLIWDAAGADWMNVQPGAVARLNGKVYANFQLQLESLREKSEESAVGAALMGRGATMNMACAAWEAWKAETLGVVNADPYRLAELPNYGFRDVDTKIRQAYGITDADKRRIRAAVVYALRRLTDAGDTLVTWASLFQQACGLLGGYEDLISDCTSELFAEGVLKAFAESEGVALAADFRAESDIWDFVNNKQEKAK